MQGALWLCANTLWRPRLAAFGPAGPGSDQRAPASNPHAPSHHVTRPLPIRHDSRDVCRGPLPPDTRPVLVPGTPLLPWPRTRKDMMPGRVACPTRRPPFPSTTIMRPRSWALGRRRMLKFWHAAVQVAVLASAFSCTQDLVSTKQTWHASRQRGTDRPLDFGRLLPSSRRRLDQQPAISDFSLRNATSGHIRTRTTSRSKSCSPRPCRH